MTKDHNIQAFFALLQAGLWEDCISIECPVELPDDVDWEEVYRLANEQSVSGLVLAGINSLPNEQRPSKVLLLQWIGEIQMLEQRNEAMNEFIGELILKMREAGIYTTLVKGQGVAQCYARPNWRACGDVDLLLSSSNYEGAKYFLAPLAESVGNELTYGKHLGMSVNGWSLELHGRLSCGLSAKMDRELDEIQHSVFYSGNVRSWENGNVLVFLPRCDEDVLFVFTHFLKHFYKGGGIGLRQICDWCRILWKYREEINVNILEKRLYKLGLMAEWQVFGTFAVEYLGMAKEAMPFIPPKPPKRKMRKLCRQILESGNMGHNKSQSYRVKFSKPISNVITFFRRFKEFLYIFSIFPKNTPLFFFTYVSHRLKEALK